MKDILVIHPSDATTDCLCALYQDRDDCDVIRDPSTTSEVVTEQIRLHNKILLLGHGTPYGLLAFAGGSRFGRYIVDLSHKHLFEDKTKQVWSIWCYSSEYFKNIDATPGIHTGMIISEVGEEWGALAEAPLDEEEMNANMELFCKAFSKNIDFDNPIVARNHILGEYRGQDRVTKFNRKNINVI